MHTYKDKQNYTQIQGKIKKFGPNCPEQAWYSQSICCGHGAQAINNRMS